MKDRRRWSIVWTLFFSTAINYINRQTLSVLAPVISKESHLSHSELSDIFGAFQFAYAGTGCWAAFFWISIATRLGLTIAVVWWSIVPVLRARKWICVVSCIPMVAGIPAVLTGSPFYSLAFICIVLFGYASWSTTGLTFFSDLFPSEVVASVTERTCGRTRGNAVYAVDWDADRSLLVLDGGNRTLARDRQRLCLDPSGATDMTVYIYILEGTDFRSTVRTLPSEKEVI